MPHCKICSSPTRELRDEKKSISYFRCVACDFIALDEACIIDPQSERKHYEKHNNSFACDGYVRMFETFIEEAICPYESRIETALDFGCGRGPVLAELLRQRGMEVDLYDLYFYPDKLYREKSYDLITATEVFEHLSDPMGVVEELAGALNQGGYLIVMTQFPSKSDEAFLDWWYRRDVTHISFFSPRSFAIMASTVGLEVLKQLNDNVVVFHKPC